MPAGRADRDTGVHGRGQAGVNSGRGRVLWNALANDSSIGDFTLSGTNLFGSSEHNKFGQRRCHPENGLIGEKYGTLLSWIMEGH